MGLLMATRPVEFVHLINLDADKERLALFRQVNEHIAILRQPAVEGATVDRRHLQDTGYVGQSLSYNNGSLGNALSHIQLWRRAVEMQVPITVAEDDAIFARDFVVLANALLQRLPADWDIVMWGWNFDAFLWLEMPEGVSSCKLEANQDELRRNLDAFRRSKLMPTPIRLRHSFGTMAYTVSAGGAAKLLEQCLPLRDQLIAFPGFDVVIENTGIDAMMNAAYPNVKAYVSMPPLAVSENHHETSHTRPDP